MPVAAPPIDPAEQFLGAKSQPRELVCTLGRWWHIDPQARALMFDPGSIVMDPTVQCVTQCLGISIGKNLILCLWGARSRQDIEQCLARAALGTLLDSAECVARCLGVIP